MSRSTKNTIISVIGFLVTMFAATVVSMFTTAFKAGQIQQRVDSVEKEQTQIRSDYRESDDSVRRELIEKIDGVDGKLDLLIELSKN